MSTACRVIVMAKAPVAGQVKTRLIPALGADGAARLAARFLSEAVGQALACGADEVELCGAPGATHPAFADIARDVRVALSDQGEGDLGQRMDRALARALGQGRSAVLIGTDAPALDAATLRRACAALSDANGIDAVFGPAADGGYVLVGLRRPVAGLFDGIAWSTDQVMAQTRLRLADLGVRHVELPVLSDVDEPNDLVHVPAHWLSA